MEVAYMVNGNCLRIHLATLQCLVETSGIVEDCDYKSQGSQEENYFLQVYGSNVVFCGFFSVILWIRSWKPFGDSKTPLGDVWDMFLEVLGGLNCPQDDPKWEPTGPPIDPQMKKWTKSMSSYYFKWPGPMEVTRF